MTAPRPTVIEVLEMRRARDCGAVRAFCKLKVGGFTIHGVKVIRQDGQEKAWVALPQTPACTKTDGKGAGRFPVVEATPELMARIRAVVPEHWQAMEDFREHPGDQL
jgi:hypothetical protein